VVSSTVGEFKQYSDTTSAHAEVMVFSCTTVVAQAAPTVVLPNCEIQHEEIETQICTPTTEEVCETKDVVSQSVKYIKVCKEVVNKECDPVVGAVGGIVGPAHAIGKREAEAWHGRHTRIIGHRTPVATAVHALPSPVVHEKTITSACADVVSEYCLNSPTVEETTAPLTQCHLVKKVNCVKQVKTIPKKVCTPAQSKVVVHQHLGHF
jgi:hypothetical protein